MNTIDLTWSSVNIVCFHNPGLWGATMYHIKHHFHPDLQLRTRSSTFCEIRHLTFPADKRHKITKVPLNTHTLLVKCFLIIKWDDMKYNSVPFSYFAAVPSQKCWHSSTLSETRSDKLWRGVGASCSQPSHLCLESSQQRREVRSPKAGIGSS